MDEKEIYLDKLEDTYERIEIFLENIESINKQDLDELFRLIHSLKALTFHLNYIPISELLERTENIIFFINNYVCDPIKPLKFWLTNFLKQIEKWFNEIEKGYNVSDYSLNFDTILKTKCKKAETILKEHKLLVVTESKNSISDLKQVLQKKFSTIRQITSVTQLENELLIPQKHFIITSLKCDDGNIINILRTIQEAHFDFEKVVIYDNFNSKNTFETLKEKLKIVKRMFNSKETSIKELKKEISLCADCYNEEVIIPTDPDRISFTELVSSIKPLKQTLLELKNACYSPNYSIRDISKIVEKDPVFASIVMTRINSPFMGMPQRVSKIPLACSLLGKQQIANIVISELTKETFGIEFLESLNIPIETLIGLSQLQATFLNKVLKFQDYTTEEKENIITVITFLPVAILMIESALEFSNLTNKFKKALEINGIKNIIKLEERFLGFNRLSLLLKLFEVWEFPKEVLYIVKRLIDPTFKIDETMKITEKALIVHLSFKIFTHDLNFQLTEKMKESIEKKGLELITFERAFEETIEAFDATDIQKTSDDKKIA